MSAQNYEKPNTTCCRQLLEARKDGTKKATHHFQDTLCKPALRQRKDQDSHVRNMVGTWITLEITLFNIKELNEKVF